MRTIYLIFIIALLGGCSTHNYPTPKKNNSLSKAIETGHTGGNKRNHEYSYRDEPPHIELGIIGDEIPLAKSKKRASYNSNQEHPNVDEPQYVELNINGEEIIEIDINGEKNPPDKIENKVSYGSKSSGDGSGYFTIEVSQSHSAGKHIDEFSRYSLSAEKRDERMGFLINIAITNYEFEEDWSYFDDLDHPWSIELGLGIKYYFTKESNFIQPFFTTGFSYGNMFWNYENTIYDSATGEEITSDSTEYLRLIGALGVEFKLSDFFLIAVDLQQDYTIHSEVTRQGFDDDILSDFGSTIYGGKLVFKF